MLTRWAWLPHPAVQACLYVTNYLLLLTASGVFFACCLLPPSNVGKPCVTGLSPVSEDSGTGRAMEKGTGHKGTMDGGAGVCENMHEDIKAGCWLPRKAVRDETVYVHGGVDPDPLTGAILTPIYQNTAFVQESVENYMSKGFSYTRTSNPTVLALEKKIAEMEGGFGTCCFASGMAATVTVSLGVPQA